MRNRFLFICFFGLILLQSCSWVKLTAEGTKVRVLNADEVTTCKKKGSTTVSLKAKVAGVTRNEEKVKSELETLARNSAVDLGGDTVVAAGPPGDGKQEFLVYKCIDPEN